MLIYKLCIHTLFFVDQNSLHVEMHYKNRYRTLILGTDYLTMNNHLFVRLRKNFEYITGLPVYILANKVFLSCSVVLYVHYMSIHSSRDLSWNNYLSDRFRDNSICTYI